MSRNRFIIMIAASFILMLGVALVFFALMDAQFSRGASLTTKKILVPLTICILLMCVTLFSYIYPHLMNKNPKIVKLIRLGALFGMLWLLPQGRTLYQNTQYFVHNGIVGFAMYNIIELAIGRLITTFLKESSGSKPKPPVKV